VSSECNPRVGREAGFSLIEIVVVLTLLSLLAGAAASVALRTTRGNLKQRTLARLQEVYHGMLGDPKNGDFGYLGDMGELPDTELSQLFIRGSQTPGTLDAVDGILSGYGGPYVLNGTHATLGFVDFWGSQIRYTPGTAQLTSLGPDRTLGTGDDIVYPSAEPILSGTVTVMVRGLVAAGEAQLNLRSDEAAVSVSYTRAADNSRALATTQYTGPEGSGIWATDVPLHHGYHGVTVTGLDATATGGRNFSGSVSRGVVTVAYGPAYIELSLEEAP